MIINRNVPTFGFLCFDFLISVHECNADTLETVNYCSEYLNDLFFFIQTNNFQG